MTVAAACVACVKTRIFEQNILNPSESVHNFLSNAADRRTDRQRDNGEYTTYFDQSYVTPEGNKFELQ